MEVMYILEEINLPKQDFEKVIEKYSSNNYCSIQHHDYHQQQQVNNNEGEKTISMNKNNKNKQKMTIVELKQICVRPELVEKWDASAFDPKLLLFLKCYKNSVPVPRHWCEKRKYLQGKRGVKKPPFQLPGYLACFCRMEEEEDSDVKLKEKQRGRVRPKMVTGYVDYELMRKAFYENQTKSKLTGFGDLYYEVKEYEEMVKLRESKKLGVAAKYLSKELKEALGMVIDDDNERPPWIVNMLRYGPPPSCPNLLMCIHDSNVDKNNMQPNYDEEALDCKLWGEDIKEDIEEAEEEEELKDEEEKEEEVQSDIDGVEETHDGHQVIEFRKEHKRLYQVLEEREERATPCSGALIGTGHTYNVLLQPEDLEVMNMDSVLAARYKEARDIKEEEIRLHSQQHDFSDLVAEHKINMKRKLQEIKQGKSYKKLKNYKF